MLIKSKRVIFKDEIKPAIIEFKDGIIVNVHDYDKEYIDVHVHDYGNMYVSPGLIDTHTHGHSGYSFTGVSTIQDIYEASLVYSSLGVTSLLATCSNQGFSIVAKAIDENKFEGARILGIHSEGPFINSEQYGAAKPGTIFPSPSLSVLNRMMIESKGYIKLMTIAPELDNSEAVIDELLSKNVIVSAGHSNATYDGIDKMRSKIKHITHLGNAMSGMHHRDIGVFGYGVINNVPCELITDGNHISLPMIKLILRIKSTDEIILVSDTIALAGCPPGDYELPLGLITMKDNGELINEYNKISGSSRDLLFDIKYLFDNTNLELHEIIKMATFNPARLLDLDDELGTIDINKKADFIILDAELKLHQTFISGRKVYEITDHLDLINPKLDHLLSDKEFLNFYE